MKKIFLMLAVSILLFSCVQNKETKQTDQKMEEPVKEKTLQQVDIAKLNESAFDLFSNQWFLVTAGSGESFNPMTISWGGLGCLWGQPVATIYIRPNRFTYEKIENSKYFTLCAFDEEYRDKLQFIGTKSGRDMDKVKETNLTVGKTELGNQYYKEARLVIECEKIYYNDLEPKNILDTTYAKHYSKDNPVHRMYIGKIVNVWEKK